ncbi:single-stranded-DNA-specific exonuclease RecJ [Sellimonas catena]|uniref:Single-stranded-DNA-specific exonuclease RecJ n=3 Tax=Clostridia TaxID=186801 RepID=A0A9W6FEN9_9FIRM|nr:single-stranded-DNA-specific exonuclease RecJ [Sellimonas catena]
MESMDLAASFCFFGGIQSMKNWVLLRKGGNFTELGKRFGIRPRTAALIRNRDIIGEEAFDRYLNGTIADLYDGMLMKDMDKAVDLLKEKIVEKQSIRIIGDYDIDGVNATYILLEGLKGLGAEVDYDIPDRVRDGYGLNIDLIDRALDDNIDTIVTCDNGIAAREEIAYGKSMGMAVVVTDHHEVPYEEYEDGTRGYLIPPADAVVDIKREDCLYPFKGLCGAAVAYKLVEALYNAMGRDPEDVDYLMENVAIATVGDVMDLTDENRIFVKQGLEMLKRTKNPGLAALMECTGVHTDRLSAYHIGFVIGPCINAGGRLDTARRALELLCAKTKKEADLLAGDLKALNDSRKNLTEEAVKEAVVQVETTGLKEDKVLVVYLPKCHESIAGIVAGRLRERYYKPVFVLTKAEEGAKGSGRSIETYHMYDELSRCKDLLTRFGGHRLAAGLSLPEEKILSLRKKLNENTTMTEEDLTEKVVIDMQLPLCEITEDFVQELSLLEPFGKGNTKPVFARRKLLFRRGRVIGKHQNVLKLEVEDADHTTMDAIFFGDLETFFSCLSQKYGPDAKDHLLYGRGNPILMDVTYYPGINDYMGRRTLQITILDYR